MNNNQKQMKNYIMLAASSLALASLFISKLTIGYELKKPEFDGEKWCVDQTGLYTKDIIKFYTRNEGCEIDCITRKSKLISLQRQEGLVCGSDLRDSRYCFYGKCISEDEQAPMSKSYAGLSNVSLTILEAYVWNEDPVGAGQSDVFVHVRAQENCGPFYKMDDTICHTVTKSDSNHAFWTNNENGSGFKCRMMPVPRGCKLLFVVMDSDVVYHDHLFDRHANIDQLLDHQLKGKKLGDEYYIIVKANLI